MPGPQHDATNNLVRDHPDLAIRLMSMISGIRLADGSQIRVAGGELSDRVSKVRQADTVLVGGPPQDPWYAVISEIETRLSDDKLDQTLRYAVTLWLQLNKPVYVIVISPDRRAATFRRSVTVSAGKLEITLDPCVYGPDNIPVLTDPGQVVSDPALAALSVMAHGERQEVSETFLKGLNDLDDDDAPRYYEYAHNMASAPARRVMEALMSSSTWLVSSPFARKHFGEGKAEGLAEGLAKGKTEGEVTLLLTLLEARGIAVSDEIRARITSCADPGQFEAWTRRAAVATSAGEVFE
ncbi:MULTISPECIES: hypothetical protein [Nonomuraea]|uniref:Uncharacterized protein n=1 Tax=Nonomuraea mangrovi TaxID=2316207 RepID=A0ABW4TE24_9ACTN